MCLSSRLAACPPAIPSLIIQWSLSLSFDFDQIDRIGVGVNGTSELEEESYLRISNEVAAIL